MLLNVNFGQIILVSSCQLHIASSHWKHSAPHNAECNAASMSCVTTKSVPSISHRYTLNMDVTFIYEHFGKQLFLIFRCFVLLNYSYPLYPDISIKLLNLPLRWHYGFFIKTSSADIIYHEHTKKLHDNHIIYILDVIKRFINIPYIH